MEAPSDGDVLALDWVMGCSTLPHSTHALDGERILYLSGNVGVVYNTVTRSQTLLRGHRNPVRSVAIPPPPPTGGPAFMVSGDAGSSGDNTIIVWDAHGRPLAALDSPFPAGVAALAVSADGAMVAALSYSPAGVPGSQPQALAVWRLDGVTSARAETAEGGEDGAGAAATLTPIAQHVLTAATGDVHHSVAFNSVLQASVPAPSTGALHASGRADATGPQPTPAAACYQLATTGAVTVLFWVVFRSGGEDGDGTLAASRRLPGGDGASVRSGHLSGGAGGPAWSVAATCVTLPGVAGPRAAGGASPAAPAASGPGGRRSSGVSTTRTATVAGLTSAAAQVESGASLGGAAGALPGGRTGGGGRTATTTAFLPINTMSGATSISALTGCSDGSMILWSSRLDIARSGMLPSGAAALAAGTGTAAPPASTSAAALTALLWGSSGGAGGSTGPGPAARAAVADDMVAYTAAKNIKLSRPDYGAGSSDSSGPASVGGLNAILLSPCRRYLVVGSEDGSVRVYDMQLRLVAWWDDIDAGPIASLSFVPSPASTAVRRASLSAAAGGGAARPLPDFLLATRRSLILSLLSSSFESGDTEARRGTILLEGPDDAVVGMVAYPSTDQDLLLVAVASGCLQLWDVNPASRQLLVVRELIRPHGFAAGSAAAAAAALQAPQLYHPTCAAVDPYMRFVAVGTREGFLLLLDPATLADVQPAIPPPHSLGAGGAGGSTVSLPTAAVMDAAGEGGIAAPAAPPAPLTTLTFSADGLHLAGTDDQSHVYLWRFLRQRTTQVSARATSRLGLDSASALYGRKRSTPASAAGGGGGAKARRPRPWELVEGDTSGLEEVVTDVWAFMGRARAHNGGVVSVCFTPLPPGTLSPHVYLLDETTGEITGATPFKGGWPSPAFWPPLPADVARLFAAHDAAGISVLASVGVDRRLVLFDTGASSVAAGLVVACGAHRWPLPGMGTPCGALWYPPGAPLPDSQHKPAAARLSLLLADSAYKFRVWQVAEGGGGPHCRKTALAPTFGGSIVHMAPLPVADPAAEAGRSDSEGDEEEEDAPPPSLPFLAFATSDRVVGVTTLPLTGNPFASVGVVAHAGPVSGLAVHASGRMLFTCGRDAPARTRAGGPSALDATAVATPAGGANGSVCVWRFDPAGLRARQTEGGGGLAPYLSLLEGGSDGALFQAICDMFAYAQIRSQGEHSTLRRRAGITLPITELAAVMRALGFYPTAAEVGAMTHEVRGINAAKIAAGADPALSDTVDLPTLIQLFVNHRPVLPPTRSGLVKAVTTLAAHCSKSGGDAARPKDAAALFGALMGAPLAAGGDGGDAPDRMRWGGLVRLLSQLGERMPASELHTCLTALLGSTGGGTGGGHHAAPHHYDDDDEVTVGEVVSRVLGFEAEA